MSEKKKLKGLLANRRARMDEMSGFGPSKAPAKKKATKKKVAKKRGPKGATFE